MMVSPSQNAEKLPATRPDRMFSDAPPSRELVTTSRTWRELVDVNTFTNSGMIAPASVPQVITVASFHHNVGSLPMFGICLLYTSDAADERSSVDLGGR